MNEPSLNGPTLLTITSASNAVNNAVLEAQLAVSGADPDVLVHLNYAAASVADAVRLLQNSSTLLGGSPAAVTSPTTVTGSPTAISGSPTATASPPIGAPGTLTSAGGPTIPGIAILLYIFAIGGGALIRTSLGRQS